jgi:hypothetical protein
VEANAFFGKNGNVPCFSKREEETLQQAIDAFHGDGFALKKKEEGCDGFLFRVDVIDKIMRHVMFLYGN